MKKNQTEALIELTNNASTIQNEEQFHECLDNMNHIIKSCLQKQKYEIVEKALESFAQTGDTEKFNILLSELEFEIETNSYMKGNTPWVSNLLVIPMVLSSEYDVVSMISSEKLEGMIQQTLLEHNLLKNKNYFKLHDVVISSESFDSLQVNDLWKLHREQCDSKNRSAFFSQNNDLQLNEPYNIFYLFAFVQAPEPEQLEIMENLMNHPELDVIFETIGQELSNEQTALTLLEPNFMSEAVGYVNFVAQTMHLTDFLKGVAEVEQEDPDTSIEIGYIKCETDNEYVVFYFDGETQKLINFYHFETYGSDSQFINLLAQETASLFKNPTLWHFDEQISYDTMEQWAQDSEVDLKKIIKNGNTIDLTKYEQMSSAKPTPGMYIH